MAIAEPWLRWPKVLICDESIGMLDAEEVQAEVLALLGNLPGWELGLAMIFVTHDLSVASFCHRVIVLDKGRIAEEGPGEGMIFQNPSGLPSAAGWWKPVRLAAPRETLLDEANASLIHHDQMSSDAERHRQQFHSKRSKRNPDAAATQTDDHGRTVRKLVYGKQFLRFVKRFASAKLSATAPSPLVTAPATPSVPH